MRVAVSSDGQNLSEPQIFDTPTTDNAIAMALQRVAPAPATVCGGITRKRQAAGEEIKKTFSGPVYLENDSALAGLGEAQAEPGKIIVYLTISTGVGGARIVRGRIDEKTAGFEPGFQIIDYHEPLKHWEDYISGLAIQRETGQEPKTIVEQNFWRERAKLVAVGLHNTIMHWSPEVVILGGSMMKAPGFTLADIQTELNKLFTVFKPPVVLKLATLGDLGGLHGALVYLKQKLAEK